MSSFWRKDLIDPALDEQTVVAIREQKTWIARDPRNAQPYHNLAQLFRTQGRADEALALLLHAVSLDAGFAAAHVALAEMYAVRGDYAGGVAACAIGGGARGREGGRFVGAVWGGGVGCRRTP